MAHSFLCRGKYALATVLLLPLLAACGKIYEVNPVLTYSSSAPSQDRPSIDLDTYQFPEDRAAGKPTAFSRAAKEQESRTRLQQEIVSRSDKICSLHKADIRATKNTLDATFTEIALGGAAVATVLTGNVGKSIAAAVAGVSTATRDNLNQTIYENSLTEAILAALDKRRKDIDVDMKSKSGLPLADYPAEAAIADAQRYHQSCSFSEALTIIATSDQRPIPSASHTELLIKAYQDRLKELDVALKSGSAKSITDAHNAEAEEIRRKLIPLQSLRTLQTR